MLRWGYVPQNFQCGRTILIYKSDDPGNIKNWRPITICSILRHVIERTIDRKIRFHLELNFNQHGFMNGTGAFINSSIINDCLKDAKMHKKHFSIDFLDVSKAFASISH